MLQESQSKTVLNKLTHLGIKAFLSQPLEPGVRCRKVSDGGSLFLVVYPGKKAVWRFKYRFGGKERGYTLGRWPGISLEEARRQREVIRTQVNAGQDPVLARRIGRVMAVQDADNTFGNAFRLWLEKKQRRWTSIHYKTSKRAFERDVLPVLEHLPVSGITSLHITRVIEAIANRGAVDTAAKVLQHCSRVFNHARVRGWCKENPALELKELLPDTPPARRMPAVLDFTGLGDILRRADAARLSPQVRMAHRLTAFSTARMGNVTQAEWSEFHLDEEPAYWLIPRHKMKVRDRLHDHKVILSRTIVEDLLQWRTLFGGDGWLFPTPTRKQGNTKPISREAVEKAYRETLHLKDIHSPHGWRAAFSTLAKDNGFSRDVVELALDHLHDTDVVRAYDRGERLVERVKLMNWWGDQLSKAQRGGDLVPFPKERAA